MTHPKLKTLSQLLVVALGTSTTATLLVSPVFAQQAAPQKIEKIEVTGSNIKRVDAETSTPIVVITADDIRRSGRSSVQEILNNLTIVSGGALTDVSGGNGFSSGSATAGLRGLGSAATLTLLNGRRISPAAFNDPNVGQTAITNLNSIPVAAIERIEVVKDGASAIYGSDAIAGVINIILRKDFTGAIVSGSISQSPNNEFRVKQASVTVGYGDIAKDKFNIFGTYERFERDPVLLSANDNVDSNWALPRNGRGTVLSSLSYPGNYYREGTPGSGIFGTFVAAAPGCPSGLTIGYAAPVASPARLTQCRYNQYNDLEQSGKTSRDTAFVRGTLDINANLSAFGEVGFSQTTNTYTGAPPSSNPNRPTFWRDSAGNRLSFQLVLQPGHPYNPYAFPVGLYYRWVDLGRSRDISKTEDSRVLTGLKGTLGTWDWESSFLYNTSKANVSSGRRFLYPGIQDAVNDGSYLFNAQNSQAEIDRVSTRTTNLGKSTVKIFDLKASGEFGNLPGGAIGLATGAEFRQDSIVITPDQRIVDAQIVGLGASFANGSRNIASTYAETVLPFLKTVEGTVALRFDHYSDFGSSTNPKYGLKWKALPSLVFRSTYSTGFRAPTLPQISKASVRSYQAVNDPIRCPVTNDDADCGKISTVSAQIQYNPALQAERSSSRSTGFVWDITKDLNMSLDYFDIRRSNEIDRFSSNFEVNALFNGDQRFANAVFRDTNPLTFLPGVPNSGPVTAVNRTWLNLGGSKVMGIDVEVNHKLNLGEMGKFTTKAAGTYNISAKQAREKGQPLTEYIGGVNTLTTGLGLPRVRANIDVVWERNEWAYGARWNYIGGWNNFSPDQSCTQIFGAGYITDVPGTCKTKAWRTFDASVTYNGIKDLTLRLVVRNVTNEKPPFDAYGGDLTLGYNSNFHDAVGIYPTLTATYRFK